MTNTIKRIVPIVAIALMLGLGLTSAVAQQHEPKPLDDQDKMMMKNMAMKNMDTYMSSMEAMRGLPEHIMQVQQESIGRGRALFESQSALGVNGQACASCHPGGGTVGGTVATPMPSEVTGEPYQLPVPSLIGAAAAFPKYKVPNDAVITIGDMANNCIMMFMMAKPLNPMSTEFKDLSAYVTSLADGTEVEVGKMPAMMMQ